MNAKLKCALWVLFCNLGYLAVCLINLACIERHVYDWRSGISVMFGLTVLTFNMAAISLFKPSNTNNKKT